MQIYLSPYYAAEVAAAAKQISDPTLAAKAASVANIPTFTWLGAFTFALSLAYWILILLSVDSVAKIPDLGTYLADASALGKSTGTKQLLQIVIYDLPDRDCAAKASNGEFSIANNGQANYYNYIDQIVAQIQSASGVSSECAHADADCRCRVPRRPCRGGH